MFLDQKWWGNSPVSQDPFRDNSAGAITAATMRQFAQDIAYEGTPSEVVTYTSGTANVGLPYSWTGVNQSTHWWLQASGSGQMSSGWDALTTSDGQAAFTTPGHTLPLTLMVQLDGQLVISGATSGIKVRPVVYVGLGSTFGALGGVSSLSEDLLISPNVPLQLHGHSVLYAPNGLSNSVVAVGVRLTPASGSAIQSGTFGLDASGLLLTLTAQPSSPTGPITI